MKDMLLTVEIPSTSLGGLSPGAMTTVRAIDEN